ncbi:TonB-dependent receptor [Horticoccus sp. 23ND18S-11]|uniref:TonB-dependent receptor n=1 Tax=Horticoccus sp. 23ND18S-11 TaxID=3391832 RepID=UPI0039C9C1CA
MTSKTLFVLLSAALAVALPARAQPAAGTTTAVSGSGNTATGVITGRVFSPNTGEYMRNALITIQETGQTANAGDGGEFRFDPVPAGKATLVVTYTGYRTATSVVNVAAGATVSQEINLTSSLLSSAEGDTIKLGQFVVSTEREGSAKAIMDQRNSMNITNTVASDSFGDNAEGNVGEFLKHLPGVELDLFYGEVRTVRLGGLGSEYTSVTMDGIALASVDANNSGSGAARSFTMEMASLNSMESIEVSKTISADLDANAPAGTINLRTKRAFDRAGRRVSFQANVEAHSEAMTFGSSLGPDEDRSTRKIRPGGIFEFSDVFLNKRLGIVLNISESNVYQEALITSSAYSTAVTATDTRPLVPTTLNFQWAPRFNKRFATTLTADYKISRELNVGLGVVYNYADLWTPQRTVIFNSSTGARSQVIGTDPLLSFISAASGTVQVNPVAVSKMGETFTLLPRFGYKRGNFELEGKFAYSDSTSWYNPLGRRKSIRDTNSPTATGITYRAERSSLLSSDWKFTQIGGPDIASGASYSNPTITANDGRFGRTILFSGEVIGTLKTSKFLPVTWKTGVKSRQQIQKFEDDQLAKRYDYAPGGTVPARGAWDAFRSPWDYSLAMNDGSALSSSGGTVFMPNLRAIGDLYQQNPAAFRQNWGTNADNFYQSYVARRRRFYEEIDAAFLMGTTSYKRATFRAGVRWEGTQTEASEANTRTPAEVRAAGFPVAANGVATTIPGIEYQFLSRPRVNRTGDYDNLFPSGSFKYNILRNLDFHFGYSATIRRPSYVNLAGVWIINETAQTVTLPKPSLKPETSENFAARLAYYFEPVGQLAVTLTERKVTDLIISDRQSAAEFGYTGQDELQNYEFITFDNSLDRVKIRSMEIEYNQSLAFLGQLFRRLSIRGSYTRLYAEIPRANLTPHLASGGINYTLNKFNVYANWNWSDDVNTNLAGTTYRRHRTNLDAGAGWRLTNTYSLSVSVRNILDTPYINMQRFVTGPTAITRNETVGQSWTFAVKALY